MTISQVTFSQLACVNSIVAFTITNTGGRQLDYTITSSSTPPYTFDHTTGTLRGGQSDTVNVSMINIGGTITVSAPQVASQNVTLSCQ